MGAAATAPRRTPPRPAESAPAPALRLAAFAALCAFAAGHWAGLVTEPPAARLAAVVALATGGGAVLAATRRLGEPRVRARLGPLASAPVRLVLRGGLALGILALALGAAGLELRLLGPRNWDELADGLDQGLAGLRLVEWPYGGGDEWVRLTILLGAPALAALAAVFAFWPAGRAAPALRAVALMLLLVMYGTAVTEREFGGELLRGAILAVLVAAWIWPPRLAGREARVAGALVAGTALLAVPVAAALDGNRAWIDYRSWNWFGTVGGTTFDWSHQYGPIDWSREGTTVLQVKAERPLYWKVETLDRFDGFRWVHSREGVSEPLGAELPPTRDLNPAWEERVEFKIRNLRSELVPVAGTPFNVRGIGVTRTIGDGTTIALDGALREGDTYAVSAYVPDPSARRMRAAPEVWEDQFRRYLRISLPRPGETALEGTGRAGDAARSAAPPPPAVQVPFRGETFGATGDEGRLLRRSAYGGTYRLARRLAAGETSAYDVARRIERHLAENYAYSERPPSQEYPLEAFLFEDRIGYCQQFSGAMALMLRMNGIPARVAGGFAPGSYNRDRKEFRVRDLDAHSWVEVYFTGIGWVQFDPTPSGTPAQSRSQPASQASAATGSTDPGRAEGVAAERSSDLELPGVAPADERRVPAWMAALGLLTMALLALGALRLRAAAVRRRAGGGIEGRLAELTRALARLGYPLPERTTLLALEERLGRVAGPVSSGYVRALREQRFASRERAGRLAADRAALRRELVRHRGFGGRLRGYLALPPFSGG